MISVSLVLSAATLGFLALPHCTSMCACQFATPWLRHPLQFQLGRGIAYAMGGALAGGVSSGVLGLARLGASLFQALHWMLMAVLFFSAMLLVWRGQSLGMLLQERIHLPPALARKLNQPPRTTPRQAFKAGLLWLLMPCGVLWAAWMLAYLSGSAVQGALVMAVFAGVGGAGLQMVTTLRQALGTQAGEAMLMRASGGLILVGLALMLARQVGWVASPMWMQSLGLCL
ncbi:MAG TPA: sulfite exporter TauE/SafE family protein [Limnobacter sp.]|nr:sulfite exporter TauE/SafE family protein [Limnobacter sp.]